jgi:two-component system, chemotaxis family, chemotaxis protein CheY
MKSYNIGDLKFLVIERIDLSRRLMKSILQGLGVRDLVMAQDGNSGLDIFLKSSFDAVFTAWHLDGIDGLEFTRVVRNSENIRHASVPIVMMTSQSMKSRVAQARDAGVTEFLTKPMSVKSVYSRICAIIERPRDFVIAHTYVGPDRRRRNDRDYGGSLRREADGITEP